MQKRLTKANDPGGGWTLDLGGSCSDPRLQFMALFQKLHFRQAIRTTLEGTSRAIGRHRMSRPSLLQLVEALMADQQTWLLSWQETAWYQETVSEGLPLLQRSEKFPRHFVLLDS